jgi:hypothetical protein
MGATIPACKGRCLLLLAIAAVSSCACAGEPVREDWPVWHITALPEEGRLFPVSREALAVKAFVRAGSAAIRSGQSWEMAPAKFTNDKTPRDPLRGR